MLTKHEMNFIPKIKGGERKNSENILIDNKDILTC